MTSLPREAASPSSPSDAERRRGGPGGLSPGEVVLRALSAGLLLFSLAMFAKGLRHAWLFDGDFDMQSRVAEYEAFRQGIYPLRHLEPGVPRTVRVPYTVYPPYALVMFVPFFEPFGKVQGRIVVEVLSLGAMVAVAWFCHRKLRDSGAAAAGLGTLAALAISGNGNAIALGQFSLICAGAIAMQIEMLERGRPLAAAAWWTVSMLKPQIGLAFAALFVVRREWRALAGGAVLLGLLSLVACAWTEISPAALVEYWIFGMKFDFAVGYSLAASAGATLDLETRWVQVGAAVLSFLLVPFLVARRQVAARDVEPLVVAAFAALLGRVLMYHRFYDNVMMFPLLLAILVDAARRPSPSRFATCAAMGSSLWIPEQLLDFLPYHELIRPTVWAACAVALIVGMRREGSPMAAPTPA